ncbi:hypothetical protein SAMN04488494_1267 [Xylanibacter ruminicola]|uniref:Uncharacterized protein n=2 Tax=Xylanibacter ruminicola TaxID=839 RepID=A0A1M7FUG2_XYLRU|nr:hypothetical protein SAMN04488493_10897 [Xylanibacter ruminicola]SFC61968.1 hypothetical protein SAMN04488493_1129 [Xylanibacter ruminicola]SHM07673.1 hypothetical protein SAMN04488494_1267 [Xylanibacter ruminicola]
MGVILLFLALIAKIVVNEYQISEYKTQINDLRQAIRYNEVADSLLGVKSDSTGRYYVIHRNEKGEVMTYQDMMRTIDAQEHVIEIQDIVIRNAKDVYKFNYAVKDSSGVVIMKFWDK